MYIVVENSENSEKNEDTQSFAYDKTISLFENFKKNKIAIRSSCGGYGKCIECKVKIKSTNVQLPKLSLEEEQGLGNTFFITKERLSCQLKNLEIENELRLEIVNKPDSKK